jgi:hypothetical protein
MLGAASRHRSQAASTMSQTNLIAIENTTVESAAVKLKATLAPEAKRENETATENQALLPLTRADRLAVELLQATAGATKEMTARLQDEVAALRTGGRAAGSTDIHGQAARRLGHLAATRVAADRKAYR